MNHVRPKKLALLISLFVLLILGWSLYSLLGLKTEYSVDQFYPRTHELLKNHEQIKKQFRLNERPPYLFVLELPGLEPWLKDANINQLKKLTVKLQGRSDVYSVLSMVQVEGSSVTRKEMNVGNIFEREDAKSWKKAVLNNSLIYPLLIKKDFTSILIAVEPKVRGQEPLIKLENSLSQEIKGYFPQVNLLTAGVPIMQTRLSSMIQSELKFFLLFISFAFCAVFYLLFSHWTAIICAFTCLLSSNIFALALMSFFEIEMNAILVTLPVIVSVSVMSLLIHTLHLWSQKRHSLEGFDQEWKQGVCALKELGLPNTLGILTTALGFMALTPSPIPLISQYGWTVGLILGVSALLNQVMLAIMLPFIKPKMRGWFDKPAQWALLTTTHPKKIIVSILTLTLLSFALFTKLNFSTRLFDDLPTQDAVRSATRLIDKSFGGVLAYEISLDSNQVGFWKKSANLNRLDEMTKEIKSVDGVGTIVTVSDFFQGHIPKTNAEIAETFFLFSMAKKNPLDSFMSENGKTIRLGIRLSDLSFDELTLVKEKILQITQKYFPGISLLHGGLASYAHSINRQVAKALIKDFWQPLLLIGVFLIFMFGSLKWALLCCLPNFIPPALLIGALAISQAPVKPGVALIFSISLGFAFNNTVYFLSRLRSQMAHHKGNPLRSALLMEANPCLFESVVMFVGFAIFLFSKFNMNKTFGGFMLISIFAGFIADLFFLPAFLKVFPKTYRNHKAAALLVFLFGIQSMNVEAATMSAKDILTKSQTLLDSHDDEAKVDMKIIEANGETKDRTLDLKTIRHQGFSVLARIQNPADIKGMAFLGNINKKGEESQWIYLPSSGQVRRLVTGESKAGLLGSEISPQDLNSQAVKNADVNLLKTEKDFYLIELKPKAGTSEYSKVETRIGINDYLPQESSYFAGDKLVKTVMFKDYKKFGEIYRAQLMTVKNYANNRGTEVRLSDIKVNSGLKDTDFSQTSLKND
jgi:predicted RND superfamily exporter protein/outer membrane lipoprotein-sorting protein